MTRIILVMGRNGAGLRRLPAGGHAQHKAWCAGRRARAVGLLRPPWSGPGAPSEGTPALRRASQDGSAGTVWGHVRARLRARGPRLRASQPLHEAPGLAATARGSGPRSHCAEVRRLGRPATRTRRRRAWACAPRVGYRGACRRLTSQGCRPGRGSPRSGGDWSGGLRTEGCQGRTARGRRGARSRRVRTAGRREGGREQVRRVSGRCGRGGRG